MIWYSGLYLWRLLSVDLCVVVFGGGGGGLLDVFRWNYLLQFVKIMMYSWVWSCWLQVDKSLSVKNTSLAHELLHFLAPSTIALNDADKDKKKTDSNKQKRYEKKSPLFT